MLSQHIGYIFTDCNFVAASFEPCDIILELLVVACRDYCLYYVGLLCIYWHVFIISLVINFCKGQSVNHISLVDTSIYTKLITFGIM